MPQMELVPFNNPGNVEILNAIRGIATNDYQSRVPAATKANIDTAIDAMWNYSPARNQFIDSLVNLIGAQIVRYNSWTNPLAKFKRGMLNYGESIEEVAIGLLKAHHYNPDAEYLERAIFGREASEVESRWHKLDRQDMYKLTVNRDLLRRAFLNSNGLSEFITGLMAQINTSDNWDEFLITTSLFRKYYDEGGFFKVQIPNVSDPHSNSDDAKYVLRQLRTMADTLPFMSRKYNAAHMPMAAQPSQLELFITPEAQATIDVEGLAAAFNIGKSEFVTRTTILPAEYVNIPGFQAMLTTREFFILADNFMDMQQANNPAGVYQNFFWHHWELISASPFVPAILYTSEEQTTITVQDYPVTGITALSVTDLITDVPVTNAQVSRGGAYLIAGAATTNPAGGPNSGISLTLRGAVSGRTRITQEGVLIVGQDEPSATLTVHAVSTYDHSFETTLALAVAGPEVEGSIGQHVDEDTSTIANTTPPRITPENGRVGQSFTVDPGRWDTTDLSYAFQWSSGGTIIPGATQDTYTAAPGDATKTLTAAVSASKAGFTTQTVTSTGAPVSA